MIRLRKGDILVSSISGLEIEIDGDYDYFPEREKKGCFSKFNVQTISGTVVKEPTVIGCDKHFKIGYHSTGWKASFFSVNNEKRTGVNKNFKFSKDS